MAIPSPAEIKAKAQKLWDSGQFLRSWLAGESQFPYEIKFSLPSGSGLRQQYQELREAIALLRSQSKDQIGHGYRIQDREVSNRQLGSQRVPGAVVFEEEEDFLKAISKHREFARFKRLAGETRRRLPTLEVYLREKPLALLEHAETWESLLTVCEHFRQCPRPLPYLRQLDIRGIDTKFIEQNKSILSDLLDRILPVEFIDFAVSGSKRHGFERRYGLRFEEPSVRFRILDEKGYCLGLSDITIPLSEFARLSLDLDLVFITENKVNGLCFPQVEKALVVFGLGYGIQALEGIEWLQEKRLVYWGDLDTHGFAILSQLRGYFPRTESLLMDEETLLLNRALWGQEPADKRCLVDLTNLSQVENHLYQILQSNAFGERIRLEQERIPYESLTQALLSLLHPHSSMQSSFS